MLARFRRPAGVILPLIALLLLLAVGFASFGSMTVTSDSDDDADIEYYHLYEFHDEGVLESQTVEGFDYDENGTMLFEPEPVVWSDYDTVSDRGFLDLDVMEVLSDDVSSTSGRATFLALLVSAGLIAHLRRPFDEEESDVHGWTFATVLGLVCLASLSAAMGVLSDFGTGVESSLESGDSQQFEIEPTVSGEVDEIITGADWIISWSPGGVLWLNLVAGLLFAVAAVLHAPPVARKVDSGLEGDRPPLLPASLLPSEAVASKAPIAMVSLIGVLLLGVLLLPWMTLEQHVYVFEDDDVTASEHVFVWSVTQWQVLQTNDSLFEVEDPDDAVSSSSMDAHNAHPQLGTVTSEVSEMRWPGLTALMIFAVAAPLSLSSSLRNRAGGDSRGWRALLLIGLFITIGLGTSGFEEAVGESIDADAHRTIPAENARFYWQGGGPSAYGSMMGSVVIEGNSSGYAEAVWQPGWGATSAGLLAGLTLLCLLDLAVTAIRSPKTREAFEEGRFTDLFDSTPWVARPTVLAVVMLTIVATLGSGVGNLVLHPSFATTEDLDRYSVMTSYESFLNETEFTELADGESIELTVHPMTEGFYHVRSLEFEIPCGEGDGALVGDDSDTFDVELMPPADIDFSNLDPLTFTLDADSDCGGFGSPSRYMENQRPEPIGGQYWASSGTLAVNMSGTDVASSMPWTFRVTANVNGGGGPSVIGDDSNAYAQIRVYTYVSNVTAEN